MIHEARIGDTVFDAAGYQAYCSRMAVWQDSLKGSIPFEVGKSYLRNDGRTVLCIGKYKHAAQFDDYTEIDGRKQGWRYNDDKNRGRLTGARFDDDRTVIPEFELVPKPKSDFEEAVQLLKNILKTYKFEDGAPVMQEAAAFLKRVQK